MDEDLHHRTDELVKEEHQLRARHRDGSHCGAGLWGIRSSMVLYRSSSSASVSRTSPRTTGPTFPARS